MRISNVMGNGYVREGWVFDFPIVDGTFITLSVIAVRVVCLNTVIGCER